VATLLLDNAILLKIIQTIFMNKIHSQDNNLQVVYFQTFMYGTEKELRNVFLFLMDKMPKEREPTNISQTGNLKTSQNPLTP
jgi:transcription elongation factor GreA-like protein